MNLLLRIPRVPGVIGNDSFVVLWMGRIVQEGDLTIWSLSPLSIFGMYPFSGIPIGVPSLLAFLFWLGLSIETATFVLSTLFGVIGVLGSYRLGKEIFPDKTMALTFAAAFSISHVFLRFTYFTISARGPFLAILPWFLYISVKFIRQRRLQDGLASAILLFALFLTHELALWSSILYLGVFVGYRCIIRTRNLLRTKTGGIQQKFSQFVSRNDRLLAISINDSFKKLKRHILLMALLVTTLAAYLIGLTLLLIDPLKTIPLFLSNDTLLGVTINLVADYGLRLGVLSWLLPLGIIASFYNDYHTDRRWFHFLLIPVLALTIPVSKYTSLVFLPVLTYYSIYGFMIAWKKTRKVTLYSSLTFTVLYGVLYHSYVVNLPPFAIGLTILVGLVLVGLIGLELASLLPRVTYSLSIDNGWSVIILVIICFSIVTTDGLMQTDDSSYMSEDELNVTDYLSSLSDSGIVFVYSLELARRMQAYGVPAIRAHNEPMGLYLGWITPNEIIENTILDFRLELFIMHGRIYTYHCTNPEYDLWNKLYGLDLKKSIDYSIAIESNLEYVLIEKTESGYGDTIKDAFCPLLHSAPLASELVVDGESLALFRLVP